MQSIKSTPYFSPPPVVSLPIQQQVERNTSQTEKVESIYKHYTTSLQNDINQSCFGKLYQRFIPLIPLISDSCHLVSNTVSTGIFDFIFNPTSTSPASVNIKSSFFSQMVSIGKVLAVVSVPLAIYNIVNEISNAIRNIEVIESLLRMGEQCSWVGEAMANFLHGLYFLNAVGDQALSWIFAFNVANAVFSLSSLILHTRHLYFSRQFIRDINAKIDNEDWIRALEFIASKEDLFLQHQFLVGKDDQVVPKVKMLFLRVTRNPERRETNLATAKTVVELLSGRVSQNQFSRCLAILSALITCVGLTMLLFTPFFIASYSLLAIAPGILVGRFFMDFIKRKRFLAAIEELIANKEQGIEMQPVKTKTILLPTPPASPPLAPLPASLSRTPVPLPDHF